MAAETPRRAPRVNLLPPEVAERSRARRTAGVTVGGVVVWAVVLGGVAFVKSGAVERARIERDDAQSTVRQLQAQVAGLQQFGRLEATRTARVNLLSSAMATEISWSRVFNDLSLSFPQSASLLTLSARRPEPAPGTAAAPPPPTPEPTATPATPAATPSPGPTAAPDTQVDQTPVATLTFTGYSVERFSPGIESVLLRFDDVRAFFDAYLTTAEGELRGATPVTGFEGTVQLSEDAFTRRYADGLPPEVG